jgi:hypothetical protein
MLIDGQIRFEIKRIVKFKLVDLIRSGEMSFYSKPRMKGVEGHLWKLVYSKLGNVS